MNNIQSPQFFPLWTEIHSDVQVHLISKLLKNPIYRQLNV